MAEDGIICFQNPRLPLLIKAGVTRHWMSNLSNRKLNYTVLQPKFGHGPSKERPFQLKIENPDSCFSIDPGQISGEIAENGHISIIITRKPGFGKEDKMTIQYSGALNGKTIVRMVPVD